MIVRYLYHKRDELMITEVTLSARKESIDDNIAIM